MAQSEQLTPPELAVKVCGMLRSAAKSISWSPSGAGHTLRQAEAHRRSSGASYLGTFA